MTKRVSMLMLTGAVAALMFVAGCTSDDEEPEATEAPSAAATETVAATETAVATETPAATATAAPTETVTPTGVTVEAVIAGFSLPDVAAAVGDEVVWTNTDPTAHTVTSSSGEFSSPGIEGTDTFSHIFSAPGEYAYICTLHEGMEGTVTVH